MMDLAPGQSQDKSLSHVHTNHSGHTEGNNGDRVQSPEQNTIQQAVAPTVYRTYKRRWFGLLQLVLLNIIVSWDVRPP